MDRVLIAEDDPILRKRMETILGRHQNRFEVVAAADGQEAIDVLSSTPVSLLITDIQMPRVDGLQLLAHVHAHHPRLPCFVMTAFGSLGMHARLPEDLLRFYDKPVDVHEMVDDIVAVLDNPIDAGETGGISVLHFLQIIRMEKISCVFEIKPPGEDPGQLFFEKGELFDARANELEGEAAALELIKSPIATYRLAFHQHESVERHIQKDLDTLIQEAGR